MRRAAALSFACFVGLAALASRARAADADLPAGDEPPRFVPTAVVDTYFAYHLSPPREGVDVASLTTAGARHDEFAINLASVGARLEHAHLLGAIALQAGTSVDILYPPSPVGTSGSQNGLGSEVYKHVQVAWAGYREGDFTVAMGLFPSVFGVEGFQTTSNWNYMHALASDLTPYFQEGVKATWRFAPGFKLTGVVDNGWQTHGHLKKTPSYAYRLDWLPSDELRVYLAGHVGKESRTEGWSDYVRLYDVLAVQADLGKRFAVAAQVWGAKQGSMTAYGAVGWARWGFHERAYVAVRGEYYHDGDGFLFEGLQSPLVPAVERGMFGGSGGARTFETATLTVGWTPHESFVVKAEGSFRHADAPAFYGDAQPVDGTPPVASASPFARDDKSITALVSAAFVY